MRALATHTAVITVIGLGLAVPATAAPGDTGIENRSETGSAAASGTTPAQTEQPASPAEQAAPAAETPEPEASGGGAESAAVSANASSQGSAKPSPRGPASEPTQGPDHSQGNASTTGDYDDPQPPSNADENDGGANGDCGAYCSTRDGSASQNGKGDGEAKGKPCAGCVGKADNKNPPGQYPDGTDHNAGYECDRNQGIGKTNPAHTGCESDTTTTTETCPDGSPLPASGNKADCGKTVVKTCPDGSPLPASGKVADCEKTVVVVTCPDGSPLPTSGNVADCDEAGFIPPGIGGVDTEVPPVVTPPMVTPPVVKGVETLVPPAGVEQYRPPAQAPEAAPAQALPGAAVLPATGAAPALTALSGLALGMLALGSGLLLYRRVTA